MPSLNLSTGSGRKANGLRVNDDKVSFDVKTTLDSIYKLNALKMYKRVEAVVQNYMQKNMTPLGTRGPTMKVPFTESDKNALFKSINAEITVVQQAINKIHSNDIDLRNRVINDPFNMLCAYLAHVYFVNKDKFPKPKNDWSYPHNYISLYLTIRMYGTCYYSQFKVCDPDPDVMDYTIEGLSNKFLFKRANNVFEVVRFFSETNVENMTDRLIRGADVDLVYYSTNLKTRISNMLKEIAKVYYPNYKDKNRITSETSSRVDEEGDFFVGETTNISSSVEIASRKIMTSFVGESMIDIDLVNAASNKAKVSKTKLMMIISRLKSKETNFSIIRNIFYSIITFYLTTFGKPISAIKSSHFVVETVKAYSISNTRVETILYLKEQITKLVLDNQEDILKEGNANMLDRFKSSVYIYLVLFISRNIE